MKFSYLEIPREPTLAFPDTKSSWHPVAEVFVEHQELRSKLFYALVDTGSQFCIFPNAVARMVGVRIENGKAEEIGGIGGGRVTGYFQWARILAGNVRLRSYVAFTKEDTQVPILGHIGFLEHFRAVFDWKTKDLVLHRKQP